MIVPNLIQQFNIHFHTIVTQFIQPGENFVLHPQGQRGRLWNIKKIHLSNGLQLTAGLLKTGAGLVQKPHMQGLKEERIKRIGEESGKTVTVGSEVENGRAPPYTRICHSQTRLVRKVLHLHDRGGTKFLLQASPGPWSLPQRFVWRQKTALLSFSAFCLLPSAFTER